MNDKSLEMLHEYVLKDNDEEDDKMEEKEISEQLNIKTQNQEFLQNNIDNEGINKNNEEENLHNIDLENNKLNNNEEENNIIFKENINMNDNSGLPNNEMKTIFENPILQTSYNLFTKLRRIIIRKENLTKINYFDKWQKNIQNIANNNNINNIINNNINNFMPNPDNKNINRLNNNNINIEINNSIEDDNIKNVESNTSASIQNRNVIQNILMSNEELDQPPSSPSKSHNDIILEHQNQLLNSGNKNFQMLINPFTSINDMNFETDYSYLNNNNNNIGYNNINKNNNNIVIENNVDDNINIDNNSYNENMVNNSKLSNLSKEKKILCLSLINIGENKLYYYFKHITQALKFKIIINNYHDKLFQMDRLNKKYESILDEKSSIIINKTDEIEDLKEKLDSLSKSLKDALKKQKTLNVIPESLCSKCGGSLEESFTSEAITENQKVIKEQSEIIEKMKREMNELRNKYNLSELRLKDLDEIKKEFQNLSGVLLKPKTESSTQTENDHQSQELSISFLSSNTTNNTNINNNNNINSKTMRNKMINNKPANIKNQYGSGKNKFSNSKKKNGNIPTQQQKKVTNYNIININNNNNNTSYMSNTNNFLSSTNSNNTEGLSTMKFDSNILSTELLNLNKEFNKLKSENKLIMDKNNKFEKEKKDILDKLKNKTEMYEKYKKENEELIILINNSRYKNMIETENENKKLKMTLEQIDEEIKNLQIINDKNEQKIKDQNMQIDKMKSIISTYNSFKAQKDNLLLANTKYESEIKRLKYDLEQERANGEKTKMQLKNSEQQIEKLNKEISFYSLHINEYKNDAAKALQDAVEYQQIVSVLQSQINEYKVALNKIKQNKKI